MLLCLSLKVWKRPETLNPCGQGGQLPLAILGRGQRGSSAFPGKSRKIDQRRRNHVDKGGQLPLAYLGRSQNARVPSPGRMEK